MVLCYHGIGSAPDSGDPHGLYVTESLFAEHLDLLCTLGYRLVGAGELAQRVQSAGPAGAKGMAAVTLDDGLADAVDAAERMLAARGGRGTAFVLPGLMGRQHPHVPSRGLVSHTQLTDVASGGVLEIGSHSLTHRDLQTLPAPEVLADLRSSRSQLEELLGRPVEGLAYPFGRWDTATAGAAADAGYAYACACSGAGPWNRFALPREPVFPSTSARRLRLKAAGLYGPLAAISAGRHAVRSRVRGRRAEPDTDAVQL